MNQNVLPSLTHLVPEEALGRASWVIFIYSWAGDRRAVESKEGRRNSCSLSKLLETCCNVSVTSTTTPVILTGSWRLKCLHPESVQEVLRVWVVCRRFFFWKHDVCSRPLLWSLAAFGARIWTSLVFSVELLAKLSFGWQFLGRIVRELKDKGVELPSC